MHFRSACAGRVLPFSFNFDGMLEHGFRVRATRRRGKTKTFIFCFSRPLHPANRDAHKHDSKKIINPKRKSSTGAAEVLRVGETI